MADWDWDSLVDAVDNSPMLRVYLYITFDVSVPSTHCIG
jgi:hypothetical protein